MRHRARDHRQPRLSDYVPDFVAHMNPLGVLTARDVMKPGPAGDGPQVAPTTPVRQVMEHLRDGAASVTVIEDGEVLGTIRPDGLMGRLLNPQG